MNKRSLFTALVVFGAVSLAASVASAAPIYLNQSNISVSVGAGTSAGTFNNTFNNGATIDKVIDAPTALAEEFHNQSTHIWYTAADDGGSLELLFDFGIEYDLTTLHFWNYNAEGFDVDNIEFTFFNQSNVQVGALSIIPDLGSAGGITAQDILLAAPLNVRFVTAILSGSNRQVDFQNIGFTATVSVPVSEIPIPAALPLMVFGLGALGFVSRKKNRK
jgi:hypothetical protein